MYSTGHDRIALTRGHGTVGHGVGQGQPPVSYDPHPVLPPQKIINQNCDLRINTFKPNPFIVKDRPRPCTWNDNYLLIKDPRLRTLSGVAPLDRGFTHSSKYNSSVHVRPCYTDYKIQYLANGVPVPKAAHPHS